MYILHLGTSAKNGVGLRLPVEFIFVQNEPARNDAVFNVRFQHMLSVHKHAVTLIEITTCVGNCIP